MQDSMSALIRADAWNASSRPSHPEEFEEVTSYPPQEQK
jgi:hypothetical protein